MSGNNTCNKSFHHNNEGRYNTNGNRYSQNDNHRINNDPAKEQARHFFNDSQGLGAHFNNDRGFHRRYDQGRRGGHSNNDSLSNEQHHVEPSPREESCPLVLHISDLSARFAEVEAEDIFSDHGNPHAGSRSLEPREESVLHISDLYTRFAEVEAKDPFASLAETSQLPKEAPEIVETKITSTASGAISEAINTAEQSDDEVTDWVRSKESRSHRGHNNKRVAWYKGKPRQYQQYNDGHNHNHKYDEGYGYKGVNFSPPLPICPAIEIRHTELNAAEQSDDGGVRSNESQFSRFDKGHNNKRGARYKGKPRRYQRHNDSNNNNNKYDEGYGYKGVNFSPPLPICPAIDIRYTERSKIARTFDEDSSAQFEDLARIAKEYWSNGADVPCSLAQQILNPEEYLNQLKGNNKKTPAVNMFNIEYLKASLGPLSNRPPNVDANAKNVEDNVHDCLEII